MSLDHLERLYQHDNWQQQTSESSLGMLYVQMFMIRAKNLATLHLHVYTIMVHGYTIFNYSQSENKILTHVPWCLSEGNGLYVEHLNLINGSDKKSIVINKG